MIFEAFVAGSAESRAVSASVSRAINLFAERPSDGPARFVFLGTPGYSLFKDLASYAAPLGAMMTLPSTFTSLDRLFLLVGGRLIEVDANGALVTDFGAVPGNGGALVFRGAIVEIWATANGTDIYYLDSGGALTGPIANISGDQLETMDGYLIAATTGASPCQFQIIDPLSIVADPLDFSSADRIPGFIVKMLRLGDILWFFKSNSIEGFQNTGNADFPFEAIQGALIEMGAMVGSVARVGEKDALFVCTSERGGLSVRLLRGGETQRVSTHAVEKWLASVPNSLGALSYGYTQEGHDFYHVTLLDEDGHAVDRAFVFDLTTNQWHERSSVGVTDDDFIGLPIHSHAYAFGKHIVGVYGVRGMFEMSLDTYTDAIAIMRGAGTAPLGEIQRDRIAPYIGEQKRFTKFPGFELEMDTGQGNSDDANPQISLCWSNDGGRIYTPKSNRGIGVSGDHRRTVRWPRLGITKGMRVFKVSTRARVPIAITTALLDDPQVGAF